jgi:hypothetical protein
VVEIDPEPEREYLLSVERVFERRECEGACGWVSAHGQQRRTPAFFMGKNTPERQDFIIGNLKMEKDLIEIYKCAK